MIKVQITSDVAGEGKSTVARMIFDALLETAVNVRLESKDGAGTIGVNQQRKRVQHLASVSHLVVVVDGDLECVTPKTR